MSGLIAIPCKPDQARYVEFYQSIFMLEKPEGTIVRLYPGWYPHEQRTKAAKEAVNHKLDWVFYVDDDQVLPPDTLMRLLKHDVDIISCNLLSRSAPFLPYMFTRPNANGQPIVEPLGDKVGVILVDACGAGGLLIKTFVLKALLERDYAPFDVNEHLGTDDLFFCHLARTHGYKIHVDLNTISGHIVSSVIYPTRSTKGWETTAVIANAVKFEFPAYGKKGY